MARHVPQDVPTVLLVEDHQDDRAMYAEYLSVHGFEPIEIGTTDEALVRAVDADSIVTGIRVAGSFDGVELVRRLRADPRTASKPIIVLTASVMDDRKDAAIAAGCDIFLDKPCLPAAFLSQIQRAMASRTKARARRAGARSRVVKRSLRLT
jgi:CheY-like chemotaxis protein